MKNSNLCKLFQVNQSACCGQNLAQSLLCMSATEKMAFRKSCINVYCSRPLTYTAQLLHDLAGHILEHSADVWYITTNVHQPNKCTHGDWKQSWLAWCQEVAWMLHNLICHCNCYAVKREVQPFSCEFCAMQCHVKYL